MTAPKKPRKAKADKAIAAVAKAITTATGPSANTRMQEIQSQLETRFLATFTEGAR